MMNSASAYVNNRLKPTKSFYDYCKSKFYKIIIIEKNKNDTDTSPERKTKNTIKYKLRKNTNLDVFENYGYFDVLLTTPKRIEHHTYFVERKISKSIDYSEKITFVLFNLHILTENNHIKVKKSGAEYEFGINPTAGLGWDRQSIIFPQNYTKLFARSELKYMKLKGYEKISDLAFIYKYRYLLEAIINLGGTRLYRKLMDPTQRDMRITTRKLIKENKYLIKTYNFTDSNCIDAKKLKGLVKMSPANLKLIADGHLSKNKYDAIIALSKEKNLNPQKTFAYLNKHKLDYITYGDYLDMLEQLLIDLTVEIAYPKNLTAAHDELVDIINLKELDTLNINFNDSEANTSKLEYSNELYSIIAPLNPADIYIEGRTLKHCVGSKSYIESHANGETTILFLRDANNTEKSLYTLEFKNNIIIQCKGKRNSSAPESVKEFIKEWIQHLQKNRIEVTDKIQ